MPKRKPGMGAKQLGDPLSEENLMKPPDYLYDVIDVDDEAKRAGVLVRGEVPEEARAR